MSVSMLKEGKIHGAGGERKTVVHAGLRWLKGNAKPYFSITASEFNSMGREIAGGQQHELVENLWPGKYSDLIALHCSDIDGAPMYAFENGWYWAKEGKPEVVQRLLRCSDVELDLAMGYALAWRFASDARIAMIAKKAERDTDMTAHGESPIPDTANVPAMEAASRAAFRSFSALVDGMRPRWKAEAEAAMAKHGLCSPEKPS